MLLKSLLELQYEHLEMRKEYFMLWEQLDHWKKRVDGQYVRKDVIGSQALMIREEVSTARKKRIHHAYTSIYNHYGLQLKAISDCDFQMKVVVLRRLISILRISEKLLDIETKNLEKQLKSLSGIDEMYAALIAYDYLLPK